jgi:hypothetical protein
MLILTLMATAAGCGGTTATSGAAAPPVDLPAPVVGRIDVGTPDATGKSTITGTEGAVEANTIVMAINENLEAVSALWRITDALFPSAYAQSLPSVCSETGHACTTSASDGSFELQIEASIGDSIVIVLLDEEGTEISPRISVIIPSTNLEDTGLEVEAGECAGQGFVGTIKGLVNVEGVPLVVKDGDEENTNTLLVGSLSIPLPGCDCKKLMVVPTGTVDGSIVVELGDGSIWSARWNGLTDLYGASLVTPDFEILAMAPMGDPDYIVVVFETTSAGFAVGRLNLADGSIDNALLMPTVINHQHEEVTALRTIGPFANEAYLGMLAVKSDDGGGFKDFYAIFFDTVGFDDLTYNSAPIPFSQLFAPISHDIADIHLTIDDTSVRAVNFVLTDRENKKLRSLPVADSVNPLYLMPSSDLSGYIGPNGLQVFYNPSLDRESNSTSSIPGKFAIGFEETSPIAFVLIEDPVNVENIWAVADFANTTGTQDNVRNVIPGSSNPTMLSVSGVAQSVMVLDADLNSIIHANDLWLPNVN